MAEFGLIQMYYGNGKGKTTAALGTALRALGNGYKVHMVQFMKNGIENNKNYEEYGELKALRRFENFSFERYGIKEWVINTGGSNTSEHKKQIEMAINAAKLAISSKEYQIIILDEISYAVQLKLITEKTIVDLLKHKNKDMEVIITGSHEFLPEVADQATLVTQVKKVKHPYDKGIQAREGIEF